MSELDDERKSTVDRLEAFKAAIERYKDTRYASPETRSKIVRNSVWVRQVTIENGTYATFTISPPPAVGGLLMRNVDPFDALFNNTYGLDLTENVGDIIDKTIAVISDPSIRKRPKPKPDETIVRNEVRSGYAFVAMAIDDTKGELVDTLDAIKEAATRCGIQAERVDEEQSNDRITDRILKSIDAAEHVIVDLTLERPNVFYEAGYAQGKGKIPIYIARSGTKLHFDLKDYPIIFFSTYKQLKDDLEKRLRAVSSVKALSSGAEYDGAMPVEEPPPSLPPPATDR